MERKGSPQAILSLVPEGVLIHEQGRKTREVHTSVPHDTASLGLSLQYTPIAVATNVWHVLDVPANSPADQAALLPYGDYILGSPEGALHGEGALGELVEDHIGRPLRLYVYNNEYDVTREVTIQPSRDWGGEGALGCTLGYGALHQLPPPLSEPVNAPGETMFDGSAVEKNESAPITAQEPVPPVSGDYLVPAQMISSTPTSVPSSRGGKKKERHGHSPNKLMDDYFNEEETKSRQLDNAPKGTGSLPPPPKGASGPPKAQSPAIVEDEDE